MFDTSALRCLVVEWVSNLPDLACCCATSDKKPAQLLGRQIRETCRTHAVQLPCTKAQRTAHSLAN